MGLFGEKLRKHRESRGLSLDAISTTTKISTRMLRAIEEEHFDQLPGGVFNKGFVRAYARQVGLDEEEVVNDYLAALRENHIQSQAILPNFRNPEVNSIEGRDTSSRNPPTHGPFVGNTDRRDSVRKDSDRNDSVRNDNNRNISDRTNDFRGNNPPGNGLRASGPLRPRLPSEPVRLKDVTSNPSVPDRRIEARRKDARRQGDDLHRPGNTIDDAVPSAPLSFLNLTSAPSSSEPSSSHPKQLEAAATVAGNIPSRRIPWEKLAIPLLVITLVLALWAFHRRSHADAASSQTVTPQPSAVPVSAVATPAVAPRTPEPSAVPNSPTGSHSVSRSHETAGMSARSAPVLAIAKANLPVSKPHPQPVAPLPKFTLVVRAAETSWVSIAADGQPAARETLIAPANTSVRAAHEIVVEASNAAAVSFLLNGKEIPAHGSPGEARTYTFDASGLRASYALPAATGVR